MYPIYTTFMKDRFMPFKYSLFFTFLITVVSFHSCKEKKVGVKPKLQNLTEAVYSSVTVEPREFYTVYPSASGIIDQKLIEEGNQVKKGALLFKIKNTQSVINRENAKLNFDLAKETYKGDAAILKEIEEQINTSMLKMRNDSLNYEKQKRLWQNEIGSEQSFQDRKLAYNISRNDVDRLVNTYERTRKELENKLKVSRNQYEISNVVEKDFNVNSKIDGTVFKVFKEAGEAVTPNSAIATIGSTNDFILKLLVDEQDISSVYQKQKVVVVLDAYGDKTFEATIAKILPTMDERSQTFELEAHFVNPPDKLYNKLTGEGNIIVSTKANVLTLPSVLISEDNQVLTDDGWVQISTGISNLKYTEIINGIDTSTVVYKPE